MVASTPKVYLHDYGCLTPFGDAATTYAALIAGRVALAPTPVAGQRGGDLVPLALMDGRALDETVVPSWEPYALRWKERLGGPSWGTSRRPVVVTSSNFGVGSQYAFRCTGGDRLHLGHGAPARCVERLRLALGWGTHVTAVSHACVSAHLGLLHATRLLAAGLADEVLVFSFDFLSPFVAGGFHALKILNADFPAPYAKRETGSIGLGDGLGFAVLTRTPSRFALSHAGLYNEMHHFTANRPDGDGFARALGALGAALAGRSVWVKGHGTGTLEAGRLEAEAVRQVFPGAPLTGWKGSLGHTLGSCGLVELGVVCEAIARGVAPGTVGSGPAAFTDEVALKPFDIARFDGVVCASNAFGGAHAAFLLSHD